MRFKIESIFAYGILPLTLPLAYLEVGGARAMVVLVALGGLVVALPTRYFRVTHESFLYLILLAYSFFVGLVSGNLSIPFAILIFYWLAYWPLHAKKNTFGNIPARTYLNSYVFFGFLCALGVILQFILFNLFSLSFGKLDLEGEGRTAYGFIWKDYSFISLFLASVVPLIWFSQLGISRRLLLSGVFVLASVITSARTGPVSLMLALSMVFLMDLLRALSRARLPKSWVVSIFVSLIFLPFIIAGLAALSPRIMSLSGSGRLEGFRSALLFLVDNPIFGAAFDMSTYKATVDVIPHNMLIYVLVMGGSVFFFLFIIWFCCLCVRVSALTDRGLIVSFYTSVIGFQFIPSLYSAYYFAVLISICGLFSNGALSKVDRNGAALYED